MVGKFGDIKQIADQLAHHLAGIVVVVIGKGQAFILVKQILPHIPLHMGAHDMALGRHIIFAHRPHGIHNHQSRSQQKQTV